MRRLRRWRLILMVLSTFCLIVTIALWIRSYWKSDFFRWIIASTPPAQLRIYEIQIVSCRGGFGPAFMRRVALDSESINDQRDYLHWHPPGVSLSTDSVSTLDQLTDSKTTYLFMPTTPSRIGFQFAYPHGRYKNTEWWNMEAAIPYWCPVLLFVIPMSIPVIQLLRSKTYHRIGRCPICGYDLRASPGRCPECGNVVEKII
jgi:hypothetical protein